VAAVVAVVGRGADDDAEERHPSRKHDCNSDRMEENEPAVSGGTISGECSPGGRSDPLEDRH